MKYAYTCPHLQSSCQMCRWEKKTNKSLTLSIGHNHPYPNIGQQKFFTPNQPNLSPDTCQYLSWSMHTLVYTFKALIISAWVIKKQSPIQCLGSKHPHPNICREKIFNPNPTNLSPDICQYPSWCIHALVYTFEALIRSADAKKKSPTLPLGSKDPYPNTCQTKFFHQNPPNRPQLSC